MILWLFYPFLHTKCPNNGLVWGHFANCTFCTLFIYKKEGTFNYFFPEKSALVTSFDYKELRKLFTDAIKNPETLKYLNKTSKEFLSTLSWKNTGKEFVDILNKVK